MPDLYLEALQADFRRSSEAAAAGDRALEKQLHAGFLALASRVAATYAGELAFTCLLRSSVPDVFTGSTLVLTLCW